MKQDDSIDESGSVQLWRKPLSSAVEKIVSEYAGREWRVCSARDMSDFACHHCAILSDDSFAVFTKYSEEAEAQKQFENELAGLRYLSDHAGVMIPSPIAIAPVEHGTIFVMEGLEAIERGSLQWRQIGRTLAHIHQVKSDQCGFPMNGFVGPLYQDNKPTRDWATFYGERRLWPRLRLAIDSGNLPVSVASRVEKLIERLPEFSGPDRTPTLLHGDAQQNNFISTTKGTVVIDPAIYYGNPEIDIALVDCWEPVPEDVFDAYKQERPIDADFGERRDLWRISIYLAAVTIEGPMHLGRLTDALQSYV